MDVFTPERRSWVMRRVGTKDTRPERVVRSALHSLGYRFRLHPKALPGKPDIVLPRHRKIILVHGCFWHGHPGCRAAARPTTNVGFWNEKLDANISRDQEQMTKLERLEWKVLVLWECEAEQPDLLTGLLGRFMESGDRQGD